MGVPPGLQLQTISGRRPPRIAIKAKGRILFIDPGSVIAIQAEGNYVLMQGNAGSHLLRESISVIAEKLRPYGFIGIHRSVLVNCSMVEEIQPYLTGEYGLCVKGGKEYTVTRTYKKNLKSLAEFWIGGDSSSPKKDRHMLLHERGYILLRDRRTVLFADQTNSPRIGRPVQCEESWGDRFWQPLALQLENDLSLKLAHATGWQPVEE